MENTYQTQVTLSSAKEAIVELIFGGQIELLQVFQQLGIITADNMVAIRTAFHTLSPEERHRGVVPALVAQIFRNLIQLQQQMQQLQRNYASQQQPPLQPQIVK